MDKTSQAVVTNSFDSKPVLMISNYIGKVPVDKCKRSDRKEKRKIEVDRLLPCTINVWVAWITDGKANYIFNSGQILSLLLLLAIYFLLTVTIALKYNKNIIRLVKVNCI